MRFFHDGENVYAPISTKKVGFLQLCEKMRAETRPRVVKYTSLLREWCIMFGEHVTTAACFIEEDKVFVGAEALEKIQTGYTTFSGSIVIEDIPQRYLRVYKGLFGRDSEIDIIPRKLKDAVEYARAHNFSGVVSCLETKTDVFIYEGAQVWILVDGKDTSEIPGSSSSFMCVIRYNPVEAVDLQPETQNDLEIEPQPEKEKFLYRGLICNGTELAQPPEDSRKAVISKKLAAPRMYRGLIIED